MNKLQKETSQVFLTDSLRDEIQKIESLHTEVISSIITTFEKGCEIGERLVKIKEKLPHGQFISFVQTHITAFKLRMAQNYMKIFENKDELRVQLHNNLDISSAVKFLAKRKEKRIQENKRPTKEEIQAERVIDEHEKKLKTVWKKFQSLDKKSHRKALEYFSSPDNTDKKELLREIVLQKKENIGKTIEKRLEQVKRLKDKLEKKENELKEKIKENKRLDSLKEKL